MEIPHEDIVERRPERRSFRKDYGTLEVVECGKCPKSMYKLLCRSFLEAIAEMYEEDKKKRDK